MQPEAIAEKPINVMLVDDHQTMLWGLERLIESVSPRMQVRATARSGEEAIAKLTQAAPDVILLDLDLGGKSGLDILPTLLMQSHARALVLTGTREQATLDQAVMRGARGVLGKDAAAEHVVKAIEKVHRGELWLDREMAARVFDGLLHPAAARPADPEQEKQASLTAKERKVIAAVVKASGASNKVLAQQLFLSEHTLRNHLTSIYHKLGVGNRLELYVYATRHQLGD